MAIKVLYCLFLGLLLVLFVGWGVAALYPTPQWETEYPDIEEYQSPPERPMEEELQLLSPAEKRAKVDEYRAKSKEYEAQEKERDKLRKALSRKVEKHDRNVSLISLLIAVIVMGLGVGLPGRLPVIAEGLLLGGLFTLVYSIGWSFVRSPKIAVVPVGVGLVVTIALGYKRFVRPTKAH